MNKMKALVKMNNKRNYEDPALYCTYLCTLIIVVVIVGIICAKAILGPSVNKADTTSEDLSFIFHNIMLGFMTGTMGICYNVMLSVPLMKDKANGNIESMLAASASIKDIWISKTLSLYWPSVYTTFGFTIVTSFILKMMYFKDGFTLQWNGWFLAAIFIAVPIVYLSECFLVNLVGLCFSVEISNVIGSIFGPGFAILSINFCARNIINTNSCALFLTYIAMAVIIMIICLCLYKKIDKEKVVLSCKAEAANSVKQHGKKPKKKNV